MSIIPNSAGSLGDWLSVTPLLGKLDSPVVHAKDAPHTRSFATLYEGLATVEFTPNVSDIPEQGEGPFSRRILRAYGFEGPAIPSIKVRADEIEWAKSFLAQYENPVAFNNSCGGADSSKPDNDISNWRRMPNEVTAAVIRKIVAEGKTPLRFGTSTYQGNSTARDTFANLIDVPDMPLRQVAACYAVMGEYWGSKTGDLHLMIASSTESIAHCFVPPSAWHLDHSKHLYVGDCWGTQPVRVRYYGFNK